MNNETKNTSANNVAENTTPNTTQNTTTNTPNHAPVDMGTHYLVNVSAMETYKAADLVDRLNKRLETIENSAFVIAVYGAYVVGKSIPCGKSGGTVTISKDNRMKAKDFYAKVNRSKATVSRWFQALDMIIEAGYFDEFNEQRIPFSFDKVVIIFNHKDAFEGWDKLDTFKAYMSKSVAALAAMAKDDEEAETTEASEAETTETTEECATQEAAKMATFTYDGKTYTCKESALAEFITNHCTME